MCSKPKLPNYPRLHSLLEDYPDAIHNGLLGVAMANKNLVVLEKHNIIMRRDHESMRGRIKIIGGGGSGIEPSEINYVGKGMLTAAVMGRMYAAPSAEDVLVAIRELVSVGNEGILLLVKNYVGDKLNFGLALNQAVKESIKVQMLVIGDDVVEPIKESHGRQALAGCVLIYKIAGEMAEQEFSLDEIIEECRDNILPDMGTVSLNFPTCGKTFSESLGAFIEPDEMVFGMGLYGQQGKKKIKFCNIRKAVSLALDEFSNFSKSVLEMNNNKVILLINNHGSTSKFFENIIIMEVYSQLIKSGVSIELIYTGTFMSNVNSHGFSITLLNVSSTNTLKYLEAPTAVPAWPKPVFYNVEELKQPVAFWPTVIPPKCDHRELLLTRYADDPLGPTHCEKIAASLKQITTFAVDALISCEKQLNIIDSEAGDGDCGTNFRLGAEALKKALMNNEIDVRRPCKFLFDISDITCGAMGGMSGALCKVFFYAGGKAFQNATEITPDVCCAAFKAAVMAVKQYGKVELGERTILDVIAPAADTFESAILNGKDLIEAAYLTAATCEYKAEESKSLTTAWQKNLNVEKPLLYPDAGAHTATIWFRAVSEAFEEDGPAPSPGIFLWKFLTKDESERLLDGEVLELYPDYFITFIEQKIGSDQTLLIVLLCDIYNYCRKHYGNDPTRLSALLGTVYYTHKYFTASLWRSASEVYYFFRESILRQSVESPPKSIEIFNPEQTKSALLYFVEMYVRNLPLVRILHLPHYKLRLKLRDEVRNSGKL
ncbi:hypothetical protein RUM44_003747 [Polyplax serrata]|uniref:Triokinase/FMN cyclase n=1 Tax=Polyplax serrata TaxID=468196 RepID=A0ABR1AHD7_POLSC